MSGREARSPVAVSIGNFDGVHVGHARLMRRARELAGPSGRVVAMAFDPHPISVLRPGSEPARLTTFERRAALLREAGADEVLRLSPGAEMLAKEPDAFLHDVVRTHNATHLVEGHDFRFGQRARGTTQTLEVLAGAWGVHAEIVPPVEVDLLDQSVVRASSSLVRELVACGRVRDAARVLARRYEVTGEVRQGDQRGRTIGFPTANVAAETLLPADGVYAATALLADGSRHPAAVNIGTRPTFDGFDRRVEAHLIGASLAMAYGWRVTLEFHSFVRDQVRFDGVTRLTAQLQADCRRVLQLLECDVTA